VTPMMRCRTKSDADFGPVFAAKTVSFSASENEHPSRSGA